MTKFFNEYRLFENTFVECFRDLGLDMMMAMMMASSFDFNYPIFGESNCTNDVRKIHS